jgi:ribosomal protein L7/L12
VRAGEHGTLTYRLTILTDGKPVPMSDVYSGNREHYETLKAELSEFLHLDTAGRSSSDIADENSIQSLLKQGRKVDAIALVRASQHIGLTEAVDLVNRINEKMNTAK